MSRTQTSSSINSIKFKSARCSDEAEQEKKKHKNSKAQSIGETKSLLGKRAVNMVAQFERGLSVGYLNWLLLRREHSVSVVGELVI